MLKKILIALILSGAFTPVWPQSAVVKADKHPDTKTAQTATEKSNPIADELDIRIKMASNRLVFGDEPKLTEDFCWLA